jgi:hypothetical protein
MNNIQQEDKRFSRAALFNNAARYRKNGCSASDWEEFARSEMRKTVETIGDKELKHLISYVWRDF